MSIAPARPASTVVLLRGVEGAQRGFEVFLVRRHDNVAFMGGAHVFPGGRVDERDGGDAPHAWCDGVESTRARMPSRGAGEAVAFYIAAVRELFEEAGVLLARDSGGEIVAIHADARPRFEAYRRELAAGTMTLRGVAAREDVRPALDILMLFAHWVTPEIETRRFDTYFFLAVAPPGQDAAHDERETSDGIWIAPAEATERALRGEIALPPPTWTTLRALARCQDVADARRWAEAQSAPRVQPIVRDRDDGTREILLPGDPDVPAVPGFEPSETRFLLRDGRWRPDR